MSWNCMQCMDCVCVCSLCFIETLAAWVILEKITKFMVVCIRIIPNKVWKWVSQYSVLKYGKNPGTTRVMECSGLKYSSTNAKVPSSVPGVDTNHLRVASVRPLVIKICLWISSFYTPLSSCLYKSTWSLGPSLFNYIKHNGHKYALFSQLTAFIHTLLLHRQSQDSFIHNHKYSEDLLELISACW